MSWTLYYKVKQRKNYRNISTTSHHTTVLRKCNVENQKMIKKKVHFERSWEFFVGLFIYLFVYSYE